MSLEITNELELRKLRILGTPEFRNVPATGNPEADILSAFIDDLIRLTVVADQNQQRLRMMSKLLDNLPDLVQRQCRGGATLALTISKQSADYATELIKLRRKLQSAGLHLGTREWT